MACGSKKSMRIPRMRKTSWWRRIDGRYWTLGAMGATKAQAREKAKELRKEGYFARVVPTPLSDIRRFKFSRGTHDVLISGKPLKDLRGGGE